MAPDVSRATGSRAHAPAVERVRSCLKNNTFLGMLPDAALDAVLRRGHIKRYTRGETIYRRGESGDSMMVVLEGRIKITNITADAREVVLNFLGAGDVNGEIAVLDGKARTADAVVLQDCEIFAIYARDLLPVLTAHPAALLEIIQLLCEKLRSASAMIEDNLLEMRVRTARGLLRLAQQHGRASKDGIRLELSASQKELGAYLGLSRANVSRQLTELKEAKVIRLDRTQIVIVDQEGLSLVAAASDG